MLFFFFLFNPIISLIKTLLWLIEKLAFISSNFPNLGLYYFVREHISYLYLYIRPVVVFGKGYFKLKNKIL